MPRSAKKFLTALQIVLAPICCQKCVVTMLGKKIPDSTTDIPCTHLCLEGRRCNAAIKPSAIAGIRRRRKGQKVQIVSSLNNLQFLTFGVHCTLTDIAEAQQ